MMVKWDEQRRLYTPRHRAAFRATKTAAALSVVAVIGGTFLIIGFLTSAVIAAIGEGR